MTTVSPKKNHDPARVNEISEKLMENPELASLISELSTTADDASELVKGLLQASIKPTIFPLSSSKSTHWWPSRAWMILCVTIFTAASTFALSFGRRARVGSAAVL